MCAVGLIVGVLLATPGLAAAGLAAAQPGSPDLAGLVAAVANADQKLGDLGAAIQAQQEGVKTLDRVGRYQYDVAGDYLEWGLAQAKAALEKANADVARDTATGVTKLPVTGVIGGRERCILAPNGAPDCRVAAEALCRAKGYVGGTSVDFETVEKCPPPYRVSGRNTPEGVCTMEHFVTRALCQ